MSGCCKCWRAGGAACVLVASCESPDTEYDPYTIPASYHHQQQQNPSTTNFHPHTPWYWGGCSSLQNRFAVCHSAHKSQTRGRRDSRLIDGVVISTQAIEVLPSQHSQLPPYPVAWVTDIPALLTLSHGEGKRAGQIPAQRMLLGRFLMANPVSTEVTF